MKIESRSRIAHRALSGETAEARAIRRWAVARLILGVLQMVGAVFSLGLFFESGITPLTLASVLVTGMFTGISMLLFQVLKRGQQTDKNSTGRNPSS